MSVIWGLILFSAGTAFLFRLLPFFIKNSRALNHQQGSFYRFLSYSTQAMLGVIIYDTAFHAQGFLALAAHISGLEVLRLGLLIVGFVWVVRTQKILPSFFFGLMVYFFAVLIVLK